LWAFNVTYVPNDIAEYGGAAWISLTTNTFSTCPDHPTDWALFVDKGQPGNDGATGATGVTGATGATGPGTALTVTAAPSNQAYTGATVSLTYGESLVPGDLVYLKSDGAAWKADADAAGLYPVMGMAMETAASGTHVVLLNGIYRDDSRYNFTVGGVVYLSTAAGGETQTQPSGTDNVIQAVGVATHADRIYFRPDLTYITHI
jgi:hypothetical protein